MLKSILVFALALVLGHCGLSRADPMGTAFTYQGRLMDVNTPADGLYDFQFSLFDHAGGIGIGTPPLSTTDVNGVDVIGGYFTVELDFRIISPVDEPGIFNGDALWLEIGVRTGDLDDPNEYTILQPRQEITPTPYAIYAKTAGTTVSGCVCDGTGGRIAKFTGDNDLGDSVIYESPSGNIAIGTTVATSNKLTVITTEASGTAVYGHASATGDYMNFGGYFKADGEQGQGVLGYAKGTEGLGVHGYAIGDNGTGVLGHVSGSEGMGVSGYAANDVNCTNYGGYFEARGQQGRGVYGQATNTADVRNYGGYFLAEGQQGMGTYSLARGTEGRGVMGVAGNASLVENYGGYFAANGGQGRGVYGVAHSLGEEVNYGGYFVAKGCAGRGVYGEARSLGAYLNYGGYFVAHGGLGLGVYGEARGREGNGMYGKGLGAEGVGVHGWGEGYDFYASGPGTNYGSPSSIRWKSNIRPI
ncbi:MAG: hypothetical protein PVJ86_14570, partial [Phycisphaerales bacterium]